MRSILSLPRISSVQVSPPAGTRGGCRRGGASSYVEVGDGVRVGDRRRQGVQRAGVCDALVGPVGVVVLFELAQGVEQVALVPEQGAVQQFASAGLHPPFHERVHPRHPDPAEYDLDPRILKDGVEQGGVLPVTVADHEPGPAAGILEIHDEVPGGLRHPEGGRVRRRAQDADAPCRRARSPRTRTAAPRTG